MELDYAEIGRRIAKRRRELGLRQSQVEEKADIGYKYLSNIERGISIPSLEVLMRLASALETTPDVLLTGATRQDGAEWRAVAQKLSTLNRRQLNLADHFLNWLTEQDLR